jgi:hypothetical protein
MVAPAPQAPNNQWRALLPQLRGFPLIPCGPIRDIPPCEKYPKGVKGNKSGKVPINPRTGYGQREWQKYAYTPEEIAQFNGVVTGVGIRPGPEAERLLVLDLDGDTAIEWCQSMGCDPSAVDTWGILRDTDPGRLKVSFSLTEEQSGFIVAWQKGEEERTGKPRQKIIVSTKEKSEGVKGEQIELFYGVGQVLVLGNHLDSGGQYIWRGSPADLKQPGAEWWALIQTILAGATSPPKAKKAAGAPGQRKRSSGAGSGDWETPETCPACGRKSARTTACSTLPGGLVHCLDGCEHSLGSGLSVGQTRIGHDGQLYAVLRVDHNMIGTKYLLKVHEPLDTSAKRPGPTYQHEHSVAITEGAAVAPLITREFESRRSEGQPIIILRDPCGSGKTKEAHAINTALVKLSDIDHVIYVNKNYRNLPFDDLRKYFRFTARHRDVIAEPVGDTMRHRTRRRDEANDTSLAVVEAATCRYAWALGDMKTQGARQKHINGFCKACPSYEAGCTYVEERRSRLAFWQRGKVQLACSNVELLPHMIDMLKDEMQARTVVVFDEEKQIAEASSVTYKVPYERLDLWLQYLRLSQMFDEDQLLRSLLEQLRDLPFRIPEKMRHGFDPAELKQHLSGWIEAFTAVHGDVVPEHWEMLECEAIDGPEAVDPEEPIELRQPVLLPQIVRALIGTAGALRATRNPKGKAVPGLSLTAPSEALQAVLARTAGVVVLDATCDPSEVVQQLAGARPVPTVTLSTRADTGIDRLEFIQIPCLGALTADRRPAQKERRDALKIALTDHVRQHYDFIDLPPGRIDHVAVLDHSSRAQAGDLKWHSDHRGSNAARQSLALICFGLPWPSIGEAKAEFATNHPDGTDEDYDAWYRSEVGKELIQAVHRLRPIDLPAGIRLPVFLVTNADLSGMGFDIRQAAAADYTWLAGDPHQRTIALACAALDDLFGPIAHRIPQALLCSAAGIPRSTLTDALRAHSMSWADLLALAPWRAARIEDDARPKPRGRRAKPHPLITWLAAQPPGFWARA